MNITAEDFLKKIGEDEKLIRQKQKERAFWEELAYSATANVESVRVKSSSDGTALQKKAIEIIMIDQEIQALKSDIIYRVGVMSKLNVSEYVLLHEAYVQHVPYIDIAKKAHRSYSSVMKLRRCALDNLQIIINSNYYT